MLQCILHHLKKLFSIFHFRLILGGHNIESDSFMQYDNTCAIAKLNYLGDICWINNFDIHFCLRLYVFKIILEQKTKQFIMTEYWLIRNMRTNRRERKNKALRQWCKNNRDKYDNNTTNQSLESLTCDRILKTALSPCHIGDTLAVIHDINAGFSGKIKVLKAKKRLF